MYRILLHVFLLSLAAVMISGCSLIRPQDMSYDEPALEGTYHKVTMLPDYILPHAEGRLGYHSCGLVEFEGPSFDAASKWSVSFDWTRNKASGRLATSNDLRLLDYRIVRSGTRVSVHLDTARSQTILEYIVTTNAAGEEVLLLLSAE